jgi:hypothetical protein|tara:strand:- start:442 stop:699 length:258 start_codon:yes stop_codon:yes gene_type:complete
MSNEYEFKVHNFYNYTLEELPKLKEEFEASVSSFESMYEQTINFKEAEADLKKLNKDEWYKKYANNGDYWVEDDYIYTLAEDHYK